ncbi:MAG: ribose 5-phosphate isomerase A [Planctomycetota bacterium]|nr:MAG: ribose 5-phosphate isomerase A [Planctomycetota bacterium]
MDSSQRSKQAAGFAAADQIQDGLRLGLGTGSTVRFFIDRLGQRIQQEGISVQGVPTSIHTQNLAEKLGIPIFNLDQMPELDLVVDGADEVDPAFRTIKGGGGALLREKMVATAAKRVLIVVGEGKMVPKLGSTFPLPVEVVPFGLTFTQRQIADLGCRPLLRRKSDGNLFQTDNQHYIFDCEFSGGIADPESLHARLLALPGVVETGLFLDLCHGVVEGLADGSVRHHHRSTG